MRLFSIVIQNRIKWVYSIRMYIERLCVIVLKTRA